VLKAFLLSLLTVIQLVLPCLLLIWLEASDMVVIAIAKNLLHIMPLF